jgi:hypothetical protein
LKKKNNTKIKSKKTKEKLLELPEKVIIVSHETDGKNHKFKRLKNQKLIENSILILQKTSLKSTVTVESVERFLTDTDFRISTLKQLERKTATDDIKEENLSLLNYFRENFESEIFEGDLLADNCDRRVFKIIA